MLYMFVFQTNKTGTWKSDYVELNEMRRVTADQVALHSVSLFTKLCLIIGNWFVNYIISDYIKQAARPKAQCMRAHPHEHPHHQQHAAGGGRRPGKPLPFFTSLSAELPRRHPPESQIQSLRLFRESETRNLNLQRI